MKPVECEVSIKTQEEGSKIGRKKRSIEQETEEGFPISK